MPHCFLFAKIGLSPYINRFLQPDSIISNPANPQSFNRFGYVVNNPIRFNDPTGHVCSDPEDPTPTCYGSGTTRVGNRMIRGNGAESLARARPGPGSNQQLNSETTEAGEAINPCIGRPPYRPAYTCGGIVTEPGGVIPSQVPDPVIGGDEFTDFGPENPPTVNGQTFTPVYGANQRALSGAELLLMVFEYLHYNTSFYSGMTGSNAQGMIPVLHHNASGNNIIPGVGVYNNTGMNLVVSSVQVGGTRIALADSPLVPDESIGVIRFSDPLVIPPNVDAPVQISFFVSTQAGVFGNGSINYSGPLFSPVYGPQLPP